MTGIRQMKTPPISISNANKSGKAAFENRKTATQYRNTDRRSAPEGTAF